MTKNREICITFSSSEELLRLLGEHAIYKNLMDPSVPYIPILCIEKFTDQIPVERYEGMLRQMCTEGGISGGGCPKDEDTQAAGGITIIEEGREPMLLADSPASLMSGCTIPGVYPAGIPTGSALPSIIGTRWMTEGCRIYAGRKHLTNHTVTNIITV